MPLDLSQVPEAERGQAQMFFTMIQSMPTEALELLHSLIGEELNGR